uniref:50S ribosomal protein L32 n=1 Tax=Papenfussiella kuromo TaxID=185805 RepID=UPI003002ED31|nr:50S ribosomal protein L32 [Papenfussiella kuromo]
MAVPKKRRSKAKGKTRLSNWKKKGKKAATKAYNAAKTFFAKEKKVAASAKKEDKIVDSSEFTSETTD